MGIGRSMHDKEYKLTWITDHLATGHAPMSYAELDSIRRQGINAIVNLCAEFCDLHEIERDSGFEVYHLPVPDDHAPESTGVERALDWLDEAIYLGKKVLVHCRLGIGRTGTFVTSYLLRRGFGLKRAERQLKQSRSSPTSFSQWRFLRKFDKRSCRLTIREPSLETGRRTDLGLYFDEYENVVSEVEVQLGLLMAEHLDQAEGAKCAGGACGKLLILQLIEAAYLSHHLNLRLTQEERGAVVQRAVAVQCLLRGKLAPQHSDPCSSSIPAAYEEPMDDVCPFPGDHPGEYMCPLFQENHCLAGAQRPVGCRIAGTAQHLTPGGAESAHCTTRLDFPPRLSSIAQDVNEALHDISKRLFFALNGRFLEHSCLVFPLGEVVSGKYLQTYFKLLARMEEKTR